MIYLITNRSVRKKGGKDIVDSDGTEDGSDLFRVGKVTLRRRGLPKVDLLEDGDIKDYQNLDFDNLAGECGSRSAFADLFLRMSGHHGDAEKGDVLFFIHGYNYEFDESLKHLSELHATYVGGNSPIKHLVYFSWPSKGKSLSYRRDAGNARISGYALGRVFLKFRQFLDENINPKEGRPPCDRKIHLMAHSMGAQVLEHFCRAHAKMSGRPPNAFEKIFLLHADCDHDTLEPHGLMAQLPDMGDVIVYNNRSDDALLISQTTKNSLNRLGRRGPRDLGLLSTRITVVDCTGASSDLVGRRGSFSKGIKERTIDHWGYMVRKAVVSDIRQVLSDTGRNEINGRKKHQDHVNLFLL